MKNRRVRLLVRCGLAGCLVLACDLPSSGNIGFGTNATPVMIPGTGTSGVGDPYPTSVPIPAGFPGVVKSVIVRINDFSHTFPDDVDLVLVGPTGAAIVLMSDVGGTADAVALDITFSDAGASALPDNGPLVSGTFRPTNFGSGDVFAAPGPAGYVSPAPVGTATLDSTFVGTSPVGPWNLFVVDDVGGATGQFASGWTLGLVTVPPVLDHDTDGISDWMVVRGGGGGAATWFIQNALGFSAVPWGITADAFMSGDYDGDRKSDVVVWRPGPGIFYVRRTSNGTVLEQQWGLSTDVPLVPGDYDGDARTDFAVWRPSDGVWYVRRSSNFTLLAQPWGVAGDLVAPGDYDADGTSDFAVRRNEGGGGVFHILQSFSGYLAVPWGFFTDRSAPGDYDGDGRTDIAVIRNEGGSLFWYVRRSTNGSLLAMQFGSASTDKAVPGDYDGDGRTDIAVWRSTDGTFYVWRSSNATLLGYQFGQNFDYPVANFIVQPQ